MKDFRYAIRALLKSPGFTLVAVLSLGLGIGVNTTIFGLVNTILFQPMPVLDPDRIVHVYTGRPEMKYLTVSYPDYLDMREQNDVFAGTVAHALSRASLSYEGRSELVLGELVTGNYFDVLA